MAKRKPATPKPVSKAPVTDNQTDNQPVTTDPFVKNEFGVIEPQTGATELVSKAKKQEKKQQDAQNEKRGERKNDSSIPQTTSQNGEKNGGDDRLSPQTAGGTAIPASRARDGESKKDAWERIRQEGRAAGLSRRDAYDRATREIERLFPSPAAESSESVRPTVGQTPENASVSVEKQQSSDDGSVSGLSSIPESWPDLPANAQLQVEIAWVTANRLRVRSGTGVDLSKALSPAPSYSALSWLETSILFPAKFADISVKASAEQDDEKEFIRREKLAVEEIRSILKEMLDAKG